MKVYKNRKMPPKSFAKDWTKLGRDELLEKYNIGLRVFYRWKKELNLPSKSKAPPPPKMRPVPDGFQSIAPTMSIPALAKFYTAGANTVRRWIEETGAPRPGPAVYTSSWPKARGIPPQKNDHEHERAANYLRKFMAVSPCDEAGVYKLGGSHYRVGYNVMSRAELIEKANAHQDRAMRRILNKRKAA